MVRRSAGSTSKMKFQAVIVLFLALILLKQSDFVSSSSVNEVSTTANDTEEVNNPQNWPVSKFVKTLKGSLNAVMKSMLPIVMRLSSDVSPQCQSSFMTLGVGIRRLKEWAMKLVDASSKIPTGVLEGTTLTLGSYDECVDVVAVDENSPPRKLFQGQYCLVEVDLPRSLYGPYEKVANESGIKNYNTTFLKLLTDKDLIRRRLRLSFGICVPSPCSSDDIDGLLKNVLSKIGISPSVHGCQVKDEPKKIKNNQIIIMCCFGLLLIMIAIGTITDLLELCIDTDDPKSELKSNSYSVLIKTFKMFSLYSNFKKFSEPPRSHEMFHMLPGIRFFSISWLILGHSYFFGDPSHFYMLKDMFSMTRYQYNVIFMTVQNSALAVDTFFVVTGFLTTYITLKRMAEENGKLNPFIFITKRVIRLLPATLVVIGLFLIMPLFGDGPVWNRTWEKQVKVCEKYWWYNVLFIQNLQELDRICLWYTWFVAVGLQLHIILFFVLILLYRKPLLGVLANTGLIIAGGVTVAVLTIQHDLLPSMETDFNSLGDMEIFMSLVYTQMYDHVGSFCVGVLLAFHIVKDSTKKLQSLNWRILGWITATTVALAVVYGMFGFTGRAWVDQHPFTRVFYAATNRTVWCVCVAWVIYDCWTCPKSVVSTILSWQPLYYLDKLTFMAYLLHPLVMYYHHARIREVHNSDHIDIVYHFLGNLVLTYIASFMINITVEQPLGKLYNLAFSSKPKMQEKPHDENVTNGSV